MARAALFLLLVIFLVLSVTLVCGRLCADPHGCKDMRLAAPAPFTKLYATKQATAASLPHAAPCPLLPHGCPDVVEGHEAPAPYTEIPSTMARATRERHANEVQAIVRRERPPPKCRDSHGCNDETQPRHAAEAASAALAKVPCDKPPSAASCRSAGPQSDTSKQSPSNRVFSRGVSV